MRRFRYAARADRDLVDIARFSLQKFGRAQAEKYLHEIEAALEKATRKTALLRCRPELGEGVHSVRCASHVAFLIKPRGSKHWIVIAILHGRMDPARHLASKQE